MSSISDPDETGKDVSPTGGHATSAPHACDWCQRPMARPAADECVNPEHRASGTTLGLRELGCGCCVAVDRVALGLLAAPAAPPSTIAAERPTGGDA